LGISQENSHIHESRHIFLSSYKDELLKLFKTQEDNEIEMALDIHSFAETEAKTYQDSIDSIINEMKSVWVSLNHTKYQSLIMAIRCDKKNSDYMTFQKSLADASEILKERFKILYKYKQSIITCNQLLSNHQAMIIKLSQVLQDQQKTFKNYLVFLNLLWLNLT
jgi:hypothetical protein